MKRTVSFSAIPDRNSGRVFEATITHSIGGFFMRSRLETAVWTLLLMASAAIVSLAPGANARTPIALPESVQAAAAPQAAPTAPAQTKRRRMRPKASQGVPKGVQNCIDALIKIAEKDPLVEYGGRAEKIVNEGLLWNDPKSNCYVGDDVNLRKKILEMANAWRAKDASKVRSLLQEIKNEAPQT